MKGKRVLKVAGIVVVSLLVLGVAAAAGGGIVYALTRSDGASSSVIGAGPSEAEPGVVIVSVAQEGPAAETGVVRGDILLSIDEEPVDTAVDLVRALAAYEPGDEVDLTVLHGDDERTLTATLAERNGEPYLGLLPYRTMSAPGVLMLASPGLDGGAVIVAVTPESPAEEGGLVAGDVIVAVDGQELGAGDDLADLIAAYEPGDAVTLEVQRPGEDAREVTVELGEHPDDEDVAYLGVRYHTFPGGARLHVGSPRPGGRFFVRPGHAMPGDGFESGVIVRDVTEDSPAEAAGLNQGDLITAVDGETLDRPADLVDAVAAHEPGDRITLTVWTPDEAKEGEAAGEGAEEGREVDVVLGAHPDDADRAYLGVTLAGCVRVHRGWPHGEGKFDFSFEWDAPSFDGLPFDPEDVVPHLELPSPDDLPFSGDGV